MARQSVVITILEQLRATLQASPTAILSGQSVSFTITASGGRPNYIAQLINANTGSVLASTSAFSSSATVTLTLNAQSSTNINIKARVQDADGRTAESNTLTISVYVLSLTLRVDQSTVVKGTPITLNIKLSDSGAFVGGKPVYIRITNSAGQDVTSVFTSTNTATTDANGNASITLQTANAPAGTYTIVVATSQTEL
jgi:hypothetical protein